MATGAAGMSEIETAIQKVTDEDCKNICNGPKGSPSDPDGVNCAACMALGIARSAEEKPVLHCASRQLYKLFKNAPVNPSPEYFSSLNLSVCNAYREKFPWLGVLILIMLVFLIYYAVKGLRA